VADGIVTGTWKRTTTTRGIRVETVPFQSLNRRVEAGFARAAADYAAFLGLSLLP
jgi:hypothetical protein